MKASHQRVSGVFVECFWGVSGGSVAVGSSPLSACQSGRDKLLCACSHQGFVVLICVKKTPPKPTKRLILQAKALLSDPCGGVRSLLQAPSV